MSKKKLFLFRFLFLICLHSYTIDYSYANIQSISFDFYGQPLQLDYDDGMLYPYDLQIEERALRQAYDRLANRPYRVLLDAIRQKSVELGLNDWLYVQLLRECSKQIYKNTATAKSELTTYLLLGKSGYDVRLTYRRNWVHVNILIEEILYGIPIIEEKGRQYANISIAGITKNTGQSMFLLDHQPNPSGRFCSFIFERWPGFCTVASKRDISFHFDGELIELSIHYSKGIADLMNDYPLVDEYWYMNAPLSPQLMESLIPQLRTLIKGRSTQAALELLVAFTRSAFEYKEDNVYFGKSKPMVADELFYYPFSDCEDRSALFFSLVKVLLDLPMLVIAYEDHLSIAVAAPGLKGQAVNYQGKQYIFCDPTGPKFSSIIGKIPEGYENEDFEILGIYISHHSP